MLQSTMSESGLVILAEAALVIFVMVFVAVLVRVWMRDAGLDERDASLPLEEDGVSGGGDER